MSDKAIEVESDQAKPEMALTVASNTAVVPTETTVKTSAQARVDAVANVLHKAYEKASLLELTPEQVAALKEDFPDDAFKLGAGGNPNLIYIEHAYLRDRFDSVIGMGKWALVRSRPHWAEEFTTQKGDRAVRIYADCALLIQGCLVSEAIGDMVYFPNNATQSYGDAAEGSETAAFRRCAKKIGVGLQAWKKDFCAAWVAKYARRGRFSNAQEPSEGVSGSAPINKTPPGPKPERGTGKENEASLEQWLRGCRAKLLRQLEPVLGSAWQWFVQQGLILDTERLEAARSDALFSGIDWSKSVDQNKPVVVKRHAEIMAGVKAIADAEPDGEMQAKWAAIYATDEGEIPPDTTVPRDPDAGEPADDDWWRDVEVHFGKSKGEKLGEMEKNYLYGWWANWTPKPFKGQISEADKKFRQALDAAGEHYDFKSP